MPSPKLKKKALSFSHLDAAGRVRMVPITEKPVVRRVAIAEGKLVCASETVRAIRSRALAKGDVLAVARIAAIQAAKRTDELIPLCHGLPLEYVRVDFTLEAKGILIRAEAGVTARTGVEMEALTAVSVAALTLYDMCKAVDKRMRIDRIRLVKKTKTPLPA